MHKPVRRAWWLLALAALLLAGALVAWWRMVSVPVSPHALHPEDTAVLAIGQRVYTAHCATCHGAHGEGQPNWRERNAAGLLPAPPHELPRWLRKSGKPCGMFYTTKASTVCCNP